MAFALWCCVLYLENTTSIRHLQSEKSDVKRLSKLFQELGRKSALACQDGSADDPWRGPFSAGSDSSSHLVEFQPAIPLPHSAMCRGREHWSAIHYVVRPSSSQAIYRIHAPLSQHRRWAESARRDVV